MQKEKEKDFGSNSFSGSEISGQFLTPPKFGTDGRKTFLFATFFLLVVSTGFLTSTIVLALKLNGAYPSARVHYYIWSDENLKAANKNYIAITAPDNSTLFTVMEHAALMQDNYKFEYKQYTFGKYISSIGGVQDNWNESLAWSVYQLPTHPNPDVPPTQEYLAAKGVDDIRVKDGEIILLWRRKVQPGRSKHFSDNKK